MIAQEAVDLALREGAAQKPRELASFVDWLAHRPAPRTVVEIGTLRGGTLAAWCAIAAPDAVIISVDLPGGEWGGGYSDHDVPRLLGLARPGQRLELVRGDSHDPGVQRSVRLCLGEREVDLLFIDGDHSEEGAWADFNDYSQLVAEGGVIAMHDILPHPDVPGCDVDLAWASVRAENWKTIEFCDANDRHPEWGQWGGIGVVVWSRPKLPPRGPENMVTRW